MVKQKKGRPSCNWDDMQSTYSKSSTTNTVASISVTTVAHFLLFELVYSSTLHLKLKTNFEVKY